MADINELKNQVLFEDLSGEQLKSLAKVIDKISLKKGESLFSEGDDTRGIYLVEAGAVEVSKTTPDGWKQKLAVFKAGKFFGELSVMEKRTHEADAAAVEKSELLLLSKEAFEKLEKDEAKLALAITKKIAIAMSKNLRQMNEKFINALINY